MTDRHAQVPVEDLREGDRILLPKLGPRRVANVRAYDTLGVDQAECFVVIYDPAGPGQSWENRSGMKGAVAHATRHLASIRPHRRGETVTAERLHLVGRS